MLKRLQIFFWIALLLHLLMFVSLSLSFSWESAKQNSGEDDTEQVLPAYVYHQEGEKAPTTLPEDNIRGKPGQPNSATTAQTNTKTKTLQKELDKDAIATEKRKMPTDSQPVPIGFGAHMTAQDLKSKKTVDKPLLRLLSQATSAKLFYPKAAQDFFVRGTVEIGFNINPEGQLSDLSLLKSSGSTVLDKAAMTTMKAISPVSGVDAILKEQEYIVVAIIYS